MESLSISILEPLNPSNSIYRNQRFVIELPGSVITNVITESNIFITTLYDRQITRIKCNVAFDDTFSKRLYIYPNTVLVENGSVTLYITGIKYNSIDGDELTYPDTSFIFKTTNEFAFYRDDPYAINPNTDPTIIGNSIDNAFVVTYTSVKNGSSNNDISRIVLRFNKNLKISQNLNNKISISKQYVLA